MILSSATGIHSLNALQLRDHGGVLWLVLLYCSKNNNEANMCSIIIASIISHNTQWLSLFWAIANTIISPLHFSGSHYNNYLNTLMKFHKREVLFIEVCRIFLCHCFGAYLKEMYVSAYIVLGYTNQNKELVVKSINHIHICTHNLCSYYSSGRKPHPFIQEKIQFFIQVLKHLGIMVPYILRSNDKEHVLI